MTAAHARILGEISGLVRSVADSLPPGEEITMETVFIDDLEMNSLQMANLTGSTSCRKNSSRRCDSSSGSGAAIVADQTGIRGGLGSRRSGNVRNSATNGARYDV